MNASCMLSQWLRSLELSERGSSGRFRNLWSGCLNIHNSNGRSSYLRWNDRFPLSSQMDRSTGGSKRKPCSPGFFICTIPNDDPETIGRSASLFPDATIQRILCRAHGNRYGISFRWVYSKFDWNSNAYICDYTKSRSWFKGQKEHFTEALLQQNSPDSQLFTPRLYTSEKWGTHITLENFPSLQPYHTRTLLLSSPTSCADFETDAYEWVIEFSPKGKTKLIECVT